MTINMLFVYIIPKPDMKDVTSETISTFTAKLTIPMMKLNKHTETPITNTFFILNLSEEWPATYAPIAPPSPMNINVIVKKVSLFSYEGAKTKSSEQWNIYPTVIPFKSWKGINGLICL